MRPSLDSIVNGAEIMEANKYKALNVRCVPKLENEQMLLNPLAFLFKAMHPQRVYVFAGLHYPAAGMVGRKHVDFARQLETLMDIGADGVKMHEGKPTVRKRVGVPLNDPLYDEYYGLLESREIPILFHVGDPWIFWQEQTVPEYARKRGWVYTDGTFPDNESLFAETEGVLEKFPKLKIIFAHFYWLHVDLKRASSMLDRWPTVSLDLTPGVEMFPDFSSDREGWREFFIKYQDRILFGTDNVAGPSTPDSSNVANCLYRTYVVRNFLETDHNFVCWEARCTGIALEPEVLKKIYALNFERYAGDKPKKLDLAKAIDYTENTIRLSTGASRATQSELHRTVEHLKALA
jgi:hypothetical protein